MEWLLTVSREITQEDLKDLIEKLGAERIDFMDPIPLDDTEQIIYISGPAEIQARGSRDPRIIKLSPNSRLSLY